MGAGAILFPCLSEKNELSGTQKKNRMHYETKICVNSFA